MWETNFYFLMKIRNSVNNNFFLPWNSEFWNNDNMKQSMFKSDSRVVISPSVWVDFFGTFLLKHCSEIGVIVSSLERRYSLTNVGGLITYPQWGSNYPKCARKSSLTTSSQSLLRLNFTCEKCWSSSNVLALCSVTMHVQRHYQLKSTLLMTYAFTAQAKPCYVQLSCFRYFTQFSLERWSTPILWSLPWKSHQRKIALPEKLFCCTGRFLIDKNFLFWMQKGIFLKKCVHYFSQP